MEGLRTIWELFTKRLRLSNPWKFKVPVLLSLTYLVMWAAHFSWGLAIQSYAWAICTIVGIAGFGYWSNDLGDLQADRRAGKPNHLLALSKPQIGGILLFLLALALLPWFLFFPISQLSILLLLTEFLLFVLYVLPPFRLKERGFLALVTDALYAHALPALLASLTFLALAPDTAPQFLGILLAFTAWQFALGLRNILLHQLKDADNDRRSGLRTYVTQQGEDKSLRLLANVLIPFELLAWLALLGALTVLTWIPLLAWPIFLLVLAHKEHKPFDLRTWLYLYLDDFYIAWLPLLILAGAAIDALYFLPLLLLHILLFRTPFSNWRNRVLAMIGLKV